MKSLKNPMTNAIYIASITAIYAMIFIVSSEFVSKYAYWVMWGIVTISIIATIILMTGKGSKFVTGFNTKSTEERAQYDSKKVSKQAGIFMILIDVGLIALVSYIQFRAVPAIQNNTISNYGTEITIVSLGICAYIILVAMIAVIRGFKHSKK